MTTPPFTIAPWAGEPELLAPGRPTRRMNSTYRIPKYVYLVGGDFLR